MRSRRTVSVLTGLMIIACGVVACGSDDNAVVGDVVAASGTADIEDLSAEVRVPWTAFNLEISSPGGDLRSTQTSSAEEIQAPDGLKFVGLSWSEDLSASQEMTQGMGNLVCCATQAVSAKLAVSGKTYELPRPKDGSAYFVAVPSESSAVEIAFDGVVQTVDLASGEVDPDGASPLYDASESSEATVCEGGDSSGVAELSCRAEVVYPAWIPDLGWAARGETWTAIRVSGSIDPKPGDKVAKSIDSSSMGGINPQVIDVDKGNDPQTFDEWIVFEGTHNPQTFSLERKVSVDTTSGSTATDPIVIQGVTEWP